MTTSEEQFHEELVAMVSQGQRDDGSVPGAGEWRCLRGVGFGQGGPGTCGKQVMVGNDGG